MMMGDFMEQVFNTLTQLIKEHDKIVIMTHKNPDFDGMGCAIALQQIINDFKKESYICQNDNESNKSMVKAYDYMKQQNIYHQTLSPKEALEYIDSNALLIILDVHKESMLENPSLLIKTKKVVIIDHHIKSQNYIKETILTYINDNLSSVVEFVANYIKYLNKTIDPLLATFLQVGLEIDTNNFKLKTTDKTFETAAFLSKIGADSIVKQELLQEGKSEYLKRHRIIEKSFMINSNIAMCLTDDEIYEKKDLAEIAEELLQFENVEASFVIGKVEDNLIDISARSIGTINVESYMAAIGGGGHINEAAAQIKDITIKEAKEIIIKLIGG